MSIKIQFIIRFATLIACLLAFISCSSSKQTAIYATSENFDASTYVNPKDYGYDLKINSEDNKGDVDSIFQPISMEESLIEAQQMIKYPRRARMSGAEGIVILQVYIDSTGTVKNIDVIRTPSPLLTKSSIRTIMSLNFNPAILKDEPVNSFMQFPFVFKMRHFNVRPASYQPGPSLL